MVRRLARYLRSIPRLQRVNMSLARGGVARAARVIDPTSPASWEFSGFSQNGEDGIIEYLLQGVREPNRYFVEIGSSDGLENNTTWLAMTRRFSGLWIEGDPDTSSLAREVFGAFNHGVEALNLFVTRANAGQLVSRMVHANPDLFSLDVDGTDYHLAEALFENGFKPSVCVVEYNSAFGPEARITVPYDRPAQEPVIAKLYYGCSVSGWRAAFARWGYRFACVDSNGVNAFFVDPQQVSTGTLDTNRSLHFAENYAQLRENGGPWTIQWKRVEHLPFMEIPAE